MPASFDLFTSRLSVNLLLVTAVQLEMRGRGHGRALKACANRARLATGQYPVPPWSSAPRPALLALQLSDSILPGVQMAQEDGAVRAQHLEQLLLVAAEAVLRVSSLEDLARLQV